MNLLDLVFVLDCTGSMSDYLEEAVYSVYDIFHKLKLTEDTNVRCCIIAYRDFDDEVRYSALNYFFF